MDGLRRIAAGGEVNYEGASGPCDFDPIGDILSCQFRFQKAGNRQFTTLKTA